MMEPREEHLSVAVGHSGVILAVSLLNVTTMGD